MNQLQAQTEESAQSLYESLKSLKEKDLRGLARYLSEQSELLQSYLDNGLTRNNALLQADPSGRNVWPKLSDLSQPSPTLGAAGVVARVEGARSALIAECKNQRVQREQEIAEARDKTNSPQVELYWLAKCLDAKIELSWRKLEEAEILRRSDLCNWLLQKLTEFIPQNWPIKYQEAIASPGKMAVSLAEAQAKSADAVQQLENLAKSEAKLRATTVQTDVLESNLEAVGSLSEFEAELLAASAAAHQGDLQSVAFKNRLLSPPQGNGMTLGFGAKNSDDDSNCVAGREYNVTCLDELSAMSKALHQEILDLQSVIQSVKEGLRIGIDVQSAQGSTGEVSEIFKDCLSLCEQHLPKIPAVY